VVYHLALETRRPPSWASGVRRDYHAAQLRAALGGLAGCATLHWRDDSTLAIVLRYEPGARLDHDPHQAALAAVVWAAERAELHPVRAVVTRVASHWTQGAIAGAVAGIGVSRTQQDEMGPVIALAAIAMGAIVGAFLRRDVPVFRAVHLPRAGWRLVSVEPEVSGPRFRVGLA
jgi:hypothetical protein